MNLCRVNTLCGLNTKRLLDETKIKHKTIFIATFDHETKIHAICILFEFCKQKWEIRDSRKLASAWKYKKRGRTPPFYHRCETRFKQISRRFPHFQLPREHVVHFPFRSTDRQSRLPLSLRLPGAMDVRQTSDRNQVRLVVLWQLD